MSKHLFNKRQRLLLGWGSLSVVGMLVLAYLAFTAKQQDDPATPKSDGTIEGLTHKHGIKTTRVKFSFEDQREAAGINFQHFPATRRSLMPEDMGSGLAWGDYDNDGDPDLFLVNFYGSILEPIPDNAEKGRPALYRNEGQGRFTEVSNQAGLDKATFGLAAAWGDYDNDGDLDLYITNYGSNLLYRNNGEGTFSDVTTQAGVGDSGFSAGCGWGDYDNDGHIDLYVTTYVALNIMPKMPRSFPSNTDQRFPIPSIRHPTHLPATGYTITMATAHSQKSPKRPSWQTQTADHSESCGSISTMMV